MHLRVGHVGACGAWLAWGTPYHMVAFRVGRCVLELALGVAERVDRVRGGRRLVGGGDLGGRGRGCRNGGLIVDG